MKKFVFIIVGYIVPFLILYIVNILLYNPNEGDLVRLGYLYSNPSPKSIIDQRYQLTTEFTLMSDSKMKDTLKYDVMTLGDSFSNQCQLGYNNFLAKKGISVLNIDMYLFGGNPIQKLITLTNSNFFTYIKPQYVILQLTERSIIGGISNLNFSNKVSVNSLNEQITEYNTNFRVESMSFFTDATIKIPLTNILYLFSDKPFSSLTYKLKTNTNQLFSNEPNNLLVYQDDLRLISQINDEQIINDYNDVLNVVNEMLKKKGIQLIVITNPDKYDLYYPYLKNKEEYTKPEFFTYFNKLPKEYLYINTYNILSKIIDSKQKDIYYYDDCHWSPIAAKIVSSEIMKEIDL